MDISDRKVERNTVEMMGGDEGWEDKPSWGVYTVYVILVLPSQCSSCYYITSTHSVTMKFHFHCGSFQYYLYYFN